MAVQPPTAAAAPLPRAAGSCVSAEPDAEPGPHGARPAMARVGTHRAAPPFVLGDATAQELDAVVAASAARLSESGLAGFWEGAGGERRGWVMQLPTGAGHDVLALFLQGLPGLTVTPQNQRFRTAHERLDSLVAERWRLEFKTLLGAVAPHAPLEEHWPKEAGHQAMATAYKNIWDKQLLAEKKRPSRTRTPTATPRATGGSAVSAAPSLLMSSRWGAPASSGRRRRRSGPSGRSGPTLGTWRS